MTIHELRQQRDLKLAALRRGGQPIYTPQAVAATTTARQRTADALRVDVAHLPED